MSPKLADCPTWNTRAMSQTSHMMTSLNNLRNAELAAARRIGAKVGALSNAMEARGIEPRPFFEFKLPPNAVLKHDMEAHRAAYKAQPEDAQTHVLAPHRKTASPSFTAWINSFGMAGPSGKNFMVVSS